MRSWTSSRASSSSSIFARHGLRSQEVRRCYVAARTHAERAVGMVYTAKHGKVYMAANLEFAGLSPDDARIAIFRESECHPDFYEMYTKRMSEVRARVLVLDLRRIFTNSARQAFEGDTKFDVQIWREVNDVDIPGLQVDWAERTATLDWRSLFSNFYWEERAASSRLQAAVSVYPNSRVDHTHTRTARRRQTPARSPPGARGGWRDA